MLTKEQIKQKEKEAREQYAKIRKEAEKQAKHYDRQNQIMGEYLREKHADTYRDYASRPDFYEFVQNDHERVMFNLQPKDPDYYSKQEKRADNLLAARKKSVENAEATRAAEKAEKAKKKLT